MAGDLRQRALTTAANTSPVHDTGALKTDVTMVLRAPVRAPCGYFFLPCFRRSERLLGAAAGASDC